MGSKQYEGSRHERPMLYSTDMVVSILEDRKTKTRRLKGLEIVNNYPNNWVDVEWVPSANGHNWHFMHVTEVLSKHTVKIKCPYGKVGDVIWVRENLFQNGELGLEYSANHEPIDEELIPNNYGPYGGSYSFRGIPSIHMPKWAARIWLEITDIEVERLQDISEEDAITEGIQKFEFGYECYLCDTIKHSVFNLCMDGFYTHPIRSFQSLWTSINGDHSWNANPWVWVISFKVLSTNGRPAELDDRKEVRHA